MREKNEERGREEMRLGGREVRRVKEEAEEGMHDVKSEKKTLCRGMVMLETLLSTLSLLLAPSAFAIVFQI